MITRVSIVVGLLLCGLSMAAMVFAPAKGTTQFIPMMTGIPILLMGVIGLNPHRRRAATIVGVVIAAVAVLYAIARFFQVVGDHDPLALVDERVVFAMAVVATAYLITSLLSIPKINSLGRR